MNTNKKYLPIDILQKIMLFALIGLLALTVLAQANPGAQLPGRDYGFYIYIGEQILHGKLPYLDAWESKPPAIFYLNAVGLWIGHGSRWGVWAVEFISLFIALWVSYFLMKKLWGTWPALFGMLLWVYAFDKALVGGNLTEEYPMPLHFVALLLFLELLENPRHKIFNFLLGLTFGISFLFRPNNAVTEAAVIIALVIIMVFQRDFRNFFSHALWIGLGGLAPIAITAGYFWSHGLFQDLLEASLLYNLTYSNEQLTPISPLYAGFMLFDITAWVAMLGFLVAFIRIVQNPKGQFTPLYMFLLIALPMAVYFSDPARRMYEHYYLNWVPILAMLSGLAVHAVLSSLSTRIRLSPTWNIFALGILLLISVASFFSSDRADQYLRAFERIQNRRGSNIEKNTPVSLYVNNHTEPGELVLFWGAYPGENYMSDRESPTSILFYPLLVKSEIANRLNDRFMQELTGKQVVMIVDMDYGQALSLDPVKRLAQQEAGIGWSYPPDNLDEVFAFIESNYYVDTIVDGKTIYRLIGTK